MDKLQELCKDIGILENLNSKRSPEFCGQESPYLNLANCTKINLTYADTERSNEIYNVDNEIKYLKKL